MVEKTGMRKRKGGDSSKNSVQTKDTLRSGDSKRSSSSSRNGGAGKKETAETKSWTSIHTHRLICLLLLALSLFSRFYRLEVPAQVVFDETHFGKFTDWYLNGEFFFDIHPPLGKLIFAGIGYIFGYRPIPHAFGRIGQKYVEEKFYVLRAISATFGSFVPLFAYLTCREMNMPLDASLLAAIAVLCENMLLLESRLILMDAQLMFFVSLAFLLAVKMWNSPAGSAKRVIYVILVSVTGTLAISVKWTAAVTPLLIALVSFFNLVFPEDPLSFVECGLAGAIAAALYTAINYIHFKSLPNSGQGDPFMSEPFRATLKGSEWYGKLKPVGFWNNFYELTQCMYYANKGTVQPHPYMSKWYEWPIARGTMYYGSFTAKRGAAAVGKMRSNLRLFVNPAVAALTLAAVAITAILCSLSVRYSNTSFVKRNARALWLGGFFVFAWILNLLPYIAVERSSFLYHYLPGLYYAQLLLAVIVSPIPTKPRIAVVTLLSVIIIGAFVFWSPWTYAIPISLDRKNRMILVDQWNK